MIGCHPRLKGFCATRSVTLAPFRLEVLGPEIVEEDFRAVIESVDRLTGFMGGSWPQGLTLAANRIDLCWHLKEFEMNRSFAWVVRDEAEAYLGCVYVFPRFGEDVADVAIWIRSGAAPARREAELEARLQDWLDGPEWPLLNYRIFTPSRRLVVNRPKHCADFDGAPARTRGDSGYALPPGLMPQTP